MNVLIVEDNPISSKVFEHTLDKYGYETLTARDGEEALKFLDAHAEIELIITDIIMPKTDGIELVRKIKERPEWSEIPILVCTSVKPESLNNSIPMKGWKYVFKPIRADGLMQKVKEAFAQQKPALETPEQTMSRIGIDALAFREILEEFSKLVEDKIARLEQQIKEGSEEPLPLQDLLEAARLVRAERLMDVLEKLDRCPMGGEREMVRATYPLLLRELKMTRHYLEIYTS
jgi:CheY-like chemotaxis protein